MLGSNRQDASLSDQGDRRESLDWERAKDERDINARVSETRRRIAEVVFLGSDVDTWRAFSEGADDLADDRDAAGRRREADRDPPTAAFSHLVHALDRVDGGPDDRARAFDEHLAGNGQFDFAGAAHEQGHAELRFESPDGSGEGLLG